MSEVADTPVTPRTFQQVMKEVTEHAKQMRALMLEAAEMSEDPEVAKVQVNALFGMMFLELPEFLTEEMPKRKHGSRSRRVE